MTEYFKSALDNDRSPIVICGLDHKIIYMNDSAIKRYSQYGGEDLLGTSLLGCHKKESAALIERVVSWFSESSDNNMIFTSRNDIENKDVYMVALRSTNGELIGYYEKHEYRNPERASLYDFSKSLI